MKRGDRVRIDRVYFVQDRWADGMEGYFKHSTDSFNPAVGVPLVLVQLPTGDAVAVNPSQLTLIADAVRPRPSINWAISHDDRLAGKTEPDTLSEAVYQSVGAASVCWESLQEAGVFDDAAARAVADQLIKWVESHYTVKAPSEVT